jgi:hypothetical protein
LSLAKCSGTGVPPVEFQFWWGKMFSQSQAATGQAGRLSHYESPL